MSEAAAPADPREGPQERSLGLAIELPREAVPLPLMIGIFCLLGLGLFLYLNANRQAMGDRISGYSGSAMRLPAPPPPLIVPPDQPSAMPSPVTLRSNAPMALQPQPMRERAPRAPFAAMAPAPAQTSERTRGNEPALVADLTAGTGAQINAAGPGDAAVADDAVRATLIRNRASIIPQGAIIAAVLETPLNSDRPGLARALVSQDVRGFDGSRVLIPRGSRLIGEFKAEVSPGMRRVLVTWSRLIRPDGVAIRLGSPVTDALGGAGAPGSVNTHFAEKFASAVLQSALAIGVNVASQLPNNNAAFYVGLPAQTAQVGQQLAPNSSRPPTVKVREGAQIAVFVARDLDFGGTPAVR
jgi:type IV secretion system protein VirB10